MLFIISAVLPVSAFEVTDKTLILWLTGDFKDLDDLTIELPVSIATDTNNLVLNSMKNYQFTFQVVPMPRIDILLKSTESMCVGNRIKTAERLETSVFSLPLNIYPGIRLYFLKSRDDIPKSLLNKQSELLSLTSLFQEFPERILGKTKGRSFDSFLDSEIDELSPRNLLLLSGSGNAYAINYMLFKKRVDYVIEFPIEINGAINSYSQKVDIHSLPIANSPKLIAGRIACTDTEVGRKFIAEVNKVLINLYQTPEFYQAHARYINENDLPDFKRSFSQYFTSIVNQYHERK